VWAHDNGDVATTPSSMNGCRFWMTRSISPDFVECSCGWAPEAGVHYAHRDHVAAKEPRPNSALFTPGRRR
jgi:hypothetical protein